MSNRVHFPITISIYARIRESYRHLCLITHLTHLKYEKQFFKTRQFEKSLCENTHLYHLYHLTHLSVMTKVLKNHQLLSISRSASFRGSIRSVSPTDYPSYDLSPSLTHKVVRANGCFRLLKLNSLSFTFQHLLSHSHQLDQIIEPPRV